MLKSAISLLLLLVMAAACAVTQEALVSVGEHRSPSGDCTARISVSELGGFRQLFLLRPGSVATHVADDVTGIAWLSGSRLVYTASPVYGSPGLFMVDCAEQYLEPIALVAAKTFNSAYPKGADFFELKAVNGRRIVYYYGHDVDEIDFRSLRSTANERSIEKDGQR